MANGSRDYMILSEGLDAVMDLARLTLRAADAPSLEPTGEADRTVNYWGAFLHAALGPPFGSILPRSHAWKGPLASFDTCRGNLLTLPRHRGIIAAIKHLRAHAARPIHLAAQFFNADERRVPVFVIPERGATQSPRVASRLPCVSPCRHERCSQARYWQERWAVMDRVNARAKDDSLLNTHRRQPDSNFGNLIVNESEAQHDASSPLAVHVGVGAAEEAFPHLEIPANVARAIIREVQSRSHVEREDQVILDIAKDGGFWNPFSRFETATKTFLADRGFTVPALNARLMVTNNVIILQRFAPTARAKYRQFCMYYLPSWQRHASYLGVITRAALQPEWIRAYLTFAERLFGLTWAVDSVRKQEEDRRRIQEGARTAARAAIMSRNLSHNVGSHTLASAQFFHAVGILGEVDSAPDDREASWDFGYVRSSSAAEPKPPTRGEVWRARNRLAVFNSYIQSRMDFIARALGETSSQPEALLFVRDLVEGFLRQTVLLNTLLADLGYPAEALEFVVSIKKDGTAREVVFHSQHKPDDANIRHVQFVPTPERYDDVLVSVSGGMVGRHAFFAFMENVLRNAAKYGRLSQNQQSLNRATAAQKVLQVLVALEVGGAGSAGPDGITLRVQENLSEDVDHTTTARIRKHLNQDIIDAENRPHTEGHGIHEMKTCAEFLSGGRRFEKDPFESIAEARTPYEEYLASSEGVARIQAPTALRCYSSPLPTRRLTYEIPMGLPTVLQICDLAAWEDHRRPLAPGVLLSRQLSDLQPASQIALIHVGKARNLCEVVRKLAPRHTWLPYRILLVIDAGIEELRARREAVNEVARSSWADWRKPSQSEEDGRDDLSSSPIPANRFRVVLRSSIEPTKVLAEATSYWNHRIVKAFDAWLAAYKGDELERAWHTSGASHSLPASRKWHLYIGFQRDRSVLTLWDCDAAGQIVPFESEQVVLHLVAAGERSKMVASSEAVEGRIPDGAILALDNHGMALGGVVDVLGASEDPVDLESGAYHAFSGSSQMALYQLLQSPPADEFLRSMLVLSVAESLLTRIGVVDERVTAASLRWEEGEPKDFHSTLEAMQKARIYPIFQIHTHLEDRGRPTSADRLHSLVPAASAPLVPSGEGLHVDASEREGAVSQPSRIVLVVPSGTPARGTLRPAPPLDFIVIHEGIVDTLRSGDSHRWNTRTVSSLYQLAPRIVRTSGRGSVARSTPSNLPFMEFSELSDTTYREMNKIALARGLLAVTGSFHPGSEV